MCLYVYIHVDGVAIRISHPTLCIIILLSENTNRLIIL